jgi:AAA+ ATPase superfamily predicted ATPase
MSEENVLSFLNEGFKQLNKKISFEETRDVIENLDGVIGWTTYYGWFRRQGLSHEQSIEKVKEEGGAMVRKELERFLQSRKAKANYLFALKCLAKGVNDWASLKQAFRKHGARISDAQLNLYLKELMNYGFVEKTLDKYFLADPLLKLLK